MEALRRLRREKGISMKELGKKLELLRAQSLSMKPANVNLILKHY